MDKFGIAGHAINDNIIGRARFLYWLNKVTNTFSETVMLIPFHNTKGNFTLIGIVIHFCVM